MAFGKIYRRNGESKLNAASKATLVARALAIPHGMSIRGPVDGGIWSAGAGPFVNQ
jgi:hypothetical protein